MPMAPEQLRTWNEFLTWGRSTGHYFNASNSILDSFLLNHRWPFPFVPMHEGYRHRDQRLMVRSLAKSRPEYLVFRSDEDPSFWKITPYTLIFNLLDAYLLEHYHFDRKIGPYHIAKRSKEERPKTYADLLAPQATKPLDYGWAPYYLGLQNQRGMKLVCSASTGLSPKRLQYFSMAITGGGKATLTIAARSSSTHAEPLEVSFNLKSDGASHTYSIPLWNLVYQPSGTPEDFFEFHVACSKRGKVESASVRCCVLADTRQ